MKIRTKLREPCIKHAFNSSREAMEWVKESFKGEVGTIPCRAYKCPNCGLYHVTSIKKNDFVNRTSDRQLLKTRVHYLANHFIQKYKW